MIAPCIFLGRSSAEPFAMVLDGNGSCGSTGRVAHQALATMWHGFCSRCLYRCKRRRCLRARQVQGKENAACDHDENKMNARKQTPRTGLPLLSHSNAVTYQDLRGSWSFVLNHHLPDSQFCHSAVFCAHTRTRQTIMAFHVSWNCPCCRWEL